MKSTIDDLNGMKRVRIDSVMKRWTSWRLRGLHEWTQLNLKFLSASCWDTSNTISMNSRQLKGVTSRVSVWKHLKLAQSTRASGLTCLRQSPAPHTLHAVIGWGLRTTAQRLTPRNVPNTAKYENPGRGQDLCRYRHRHALLDDWEGLFLCESVHCFLGFFGKSYSSYLLRFYWMKCSKMCFLCRVWNKMSVQVELFLSCLIQAYNAFFSHFSFTYMLY